MDTHKSGFMTAFEGFWNNWGCHRENLMVIVCGSATSWITDHLINNHGGLYDRLTYEIKLSAFTNPEMMLSIVRALNTRNSGYTRQEIAEHIGYTAGGRLSAALNALIESDFVIKYVPFGFSKRKEHYRLIDSFCIFYLKFIENQKKLTNSFWQNNLASGQVVSWRGIAFENVCFNHIEQIKNALRIGGVSSEESAWSKKADDTDGTQIDLIIE